MIKILMLIAGLFSCSVNAEQLHFPKTGFSINSLEVEPSGRSSKALHMFLAPENGFSGNVNVMLQSYEGTLADYKVLSEDQFAQLKIEIIVSVIGDDYLTFEYKGMMQGQALHWYAKAFKKGGMIYLVTATDAQLNWEKNKAQLRSTVDSFALK